MKCSMKVSKGDFAGKVTRRGAGVTTHHSVRLILINQLQNSISPRSKAISHSASSEKGRRENKVRKLCMTHTPSKSEKTEKKKTRISLKRKDRENTEIQENQINQGNQVPKLQVDQE